MSFGPHLATWGVFSDVQTDCITMGRRKSLPIVSREPVAYRQAEKLTCGVAHGVTGMVRRLGESEQLSNSKVKLVVNECYNDKELQSEHIVSGRERGLFRAVL
jgi:hypothetical protein